MVPGRWQHKASSQSRWSQMTSRRTRYLVACDISLVHVGCDTYVKLVVFNNPHSTLYFGNFTYNTVESKLTLPRWHGWVQPSFQITLRSRFSSHSTFQRIRLHIHVEPIWVPHRIRPAKQTTSRCGSNIPSRVKLESHTCW